MKFKSLGLIGIILIVGVVMVSGCTSSGNKETVIFDSTVGSSGSNVQYVTVPSDARIQVIISNSTAIKNDSSINVYALSVEGQNGQSTSNYAPNILDQKSFTITNGFSGNNTFNKGVKSIAIVTNDAKANIKIVEIT